jgi:predicted butyrate kinase (DUF1464 family)
MSIIAAVLRFGALGCLAGLGACIVHPPTIAHVHIGHAVTAVHVTPGHEGYLAVAELRAKEAYDSAKSANADADLLQLKVHVAAAVAATDSQENFGVRQSVTMAANHISFAATSADASANVIRFAPTFATDTAAVVGRCDYIGLLGKDVASSASLKEASVLAQEILDLARANVEGAVSKGDAAAGSAPSNYGVVQLRAEVQAMISRESPPYRTVDQWYLFNLVRLPNGRWVFDKLGRGGTIDGYK